MVPVLNRIGTAAACVGVSLLQSFHTVFEDRNLMLEIWRLES